MPPTEKQLDYISSLKDEIIDLYDELGKRPSIPDMPRKANRAQASKYIEKLIKIYNRFAVPLSDFRIPSNTTSSHLREPLSKNRTPAKWIYPGQTVKIANYEINGGYIYWGGGLKSLNDYDTEASLIDRTLKVDITSPDYSGDHMGYWPCYCDISPQSRAAYIAWLASSRNDPNCYIGYVFLYFYGIERRLLVDGKHIPSSERGALVDEIWRLKSIYDDNPSFNTCTTSLLAHVWTLYSREKQPDKSLLIGTRAFTSVFKYLLGMSVADGIPVSSELALAWVRSHPEYSLRTPARRCAKEFDLLFKLRYEAKFKHGMSVKPNKTKLQLRYNPANPTLRGYQGQDIALDLPDPSRLKGPITKLMQLATSCTDELGRYSRYIRSNPANSRELLASIIYLPSDLTNSVQHDQFNKFKSWIRSKITGSVGVVPTKDLSLYVWESTPTRINKKEAAMLTNCIEKAGFGLAPDVRFHHAKPDINGYVVLFEGGHGSDFNPGYEFNRIGTILRLGSMVATIDGRVNDVEVPVLDKLIANNSYLSDTEKKSLHAYLHWRLNAKSGMRGLKSNLQHLNNHEKSAISHILVSVALADGKIDPTEIEQLRKLYILLGLDEAMVSSDIHNLTSKKIKSLPCDGQALTGVSNLSNSTFSLNHELLDVYKAETESVKAVLDSIFVEENIADKDEDVIDSAVAAPQVIELDEPHTYFFKKLICKEEWSIEEVQDICKEFNLMVDGAIEVVNNWAFDNVDAPLIDSGSVIYIDLEVAQEIRAL